MRNSQFPLARKNNLVVQEIPDEVLVYDLDRNKAHCLNKTAGLVWQACNGENSIHAIADVVSREVGEKITDDFVWLAIDQLCESDLLEQEIRLNAEGTSRRELLKKIGFASVVALPVIASLVAPSSVLASVSCDCRVSGNTCGQNQCPVGTCNPSGDCVSARSTTKKG